MTRLSTERVLVTEWVDGAFEEVRTLPQPERDRFGEIVFRFCFGRSITSALQRRRPPGQLPVHAGRPGAFLDFGMTKQLDQEQIALEITALEAVFDDDPERLRVALHDLWLPQRPRKIDAEHNHGARACRGWLVHGGPRGH